MPIDQTPRPDCLSVAKTTVDDEFAAMKMAHGCPVYAPKQGTDEGEALFHATRSGATSAACGDRWMEARGAAKLAQKEAT